MSNDYQLSPYLLFPTFYAITPPALPYLTSLVLHIAYIYEFEALWSQMEEEYLDPELKYAYDGFNLLDRISSLFAQLKTFHLMVHTSTDPEWQDLTFPKFKAVRVGQPYQR